MPDSLMEARMSKITYTQNGKIEDLSCQKLKPYRSFCVEITIFLIRLMRGVICNYGFIYRLGS